MNHLKGWEDLLDLLIAVWSFLSFFTADVQAAMQSHAVSAALLAMAAFGAVKTRRQQDDWADAALLVLCLISDRDRRGNSISGHTVPQGRHSSISRPNY